MRSLILSAVAFDVGGSSDESPTAMLNALDKGQIDVLITWQPVIGNFLKQRSDLEVIVVPNARTLGSPEQYAFHVHGVRHGNEFLQKRLDEVIAGIKRNSLPF